MIKIRKASMININTIIQKRPNKTNRRVRHNTKTSIRTRVHKINTPRTTTTTTLTAIATKVNTTERTMIDMCIVIKTKTTNLVSPSVTEGKGRVRTLTIEIRAVQAVQAL